MAINTHFTVVSLCLLVLNMNVYKISEEIVKPVDFRVIQMTSSKKGKSFREEIGIKWTELGI